MTHYYYDVAVFISSLDEKMPFEHTETFNKGALPQSKIEALKYYLLQQKTITEKGEFRNKKIVEHPSYEKGTDAYYSLYLYLVVKNDTGTYSETLLGGSDLLCTKGAMIEGYAWADTGVDQVLLDTYARELEELMREENR